MGRAWLWTALVLVAIAGGSYGAYLYLQLEPLPPQVLYGNGRIEGTEVRVSAEVTGRIIESTLIEGATVAAGDLLVRLDDTELRLELARARAEAAVVELERQRLAEEFGAWRHHRETAEAELARARELRQRDTIPEARLEQAEDAAQEARGRVGALDAQLGAVEARHKAAQTVAALVEAQLDKTRIHAPIDGTVLVKAVEAGEFVQPGRVVAVLVDLGQVELRVFLAQHEIGKVRLGDPARARVDAFPERDFEARVARVAQRAQFTPRDVHMPEERATQVFGVTLALANPDGLLKPGMVADAWILWQDGADWPERLTVPR
jgi:HlyD family secretion protein